MSGSASGGPRRLAGEADREQLVALLREHYALGQLDDDELEVVERAMKKVTRSSTFG